MKRQLNFYHSFPRPLRHGSRSEEETGAVGRLILEGLIRYGMVLSPEDLQIPKNPLSDLASPPETIVGQRRACFTLMSREELLEPKGHTKAFGEFSIGLDSLEARRLGIMPTIYHYRQSENRPNTVEAAVDGGLSQEILFRMSEARRVIIALAHVEAISSRRTGKYEDQAYLRRAGLTLDDEPEVMAALSKLSEESAEEIRRCFNTDKVSACNLAEWLEIILSLFQTADSKNRNTPLEYFEQREWRLIQAYSEGFHCLPLSENEILRLPNVESRDHARSCRAHVNKVIKTAKSNLKLDACYVFAGLPEKHFRDFITEIIVPSNWEDRVWDSLRLMEDPIRKRERLPNHFTVFAQKVQGEISYFLPQAFK